MCLERLEAPGKGRPSVGEHPFRDNMEEFNEELKGKNKRGLMAVL